MVNAGKRTNKWEARKKRGNNAGSQVPNQDPKADFQLDVGKMNKKRQIFCFSCVSFLMWVFFAWAIALHYSTVFYTRLDCSCAIVCHNYLLGTSISSLTMNSWLTEPNMVLVKCLRKGSSPISHLRSHHIALSTFSALIIMTTSMIHRYISPARLHLSDISHFFKMP